MNRTTKRWLCWTPRILCILFAAFLSLFALDVFGEGYSFWKTLLALLIHLVPVGVLILILGISFALMAVLYLVIQKSTWGAAVRATALDRDTAALMGINFNRVIRFIFTLGPALGALTGVMVGMYYRQISFTMGWNYGLKAFTATILGGIGNLPGAMFGGLILGVLEMFGSAYISTAWKDVFVFLILILVLIFRPNGLFGEKIAEKV